MGEETSPDRVPFTGQGFDWHDRRKRHTNAIHKRRTHADRAKQTFFRTSEGDMTWTQWELKCSCSLDIWKREVEADEEKARTTAAEHAIDTLKYLAECAREAVREPGVSGAPGKVP